MVYSRSFAFDNIAFANIVALRQRAGNDRFILKRIKTIDTLNSDFIGMTTLHVSDSLSAHHQEF